MKRESRAITGTAGIEALSASRVSLSQSLRKPYSAITGDATGAPVDTAMANEACYCEPATEKLAAELFKTWNDALQTGNAAKVASLYAEDAVLLPTVSNLARTSTAEITDYFKHFLEKKPFGTVKQRNIKKGCNKLTDAGIYSFRLTDKTGTKEVGARYTFVYEFRNNLWKIIHHHSSVMPE